MTTNLVLYQSMVKPQFQEYSSEVFTIKPKLSAKATLKLPEILFITSFPPRECGIATYSQDLINALNNQFENAFTTSICALENDSERHLYKDSPKYVLNTDERNIFTKTAFKINKDVNIKLVVLQHEFGFFDQNNQGFNNFYNDVSKPIVFVFHTILPNPNEHLKKHVKNMSDVASSIIVMTSNAANILKTAYEVTEEKISVIPHGTHLVSPLDIKKIKENHQLSNRKILSTFGLLGESKSIETTLEALPAVVKEHPEVLFLILGKTHPTILKNEGEKYRKMLEEKVVELKIEQHVRFVNAYLELPLLLEYLQITDIYLFTSKDPTQAVSGTFSYAVSSGCPVISTPIPHAKEVLSDGNGIIFDFGNSKQLSDAIISLLNDDVLRAEISSNSFHKMASTAWQNSALAHVILFEKLTKNAFQLNFKVPDINLSHIRKLTTHFGMIQFSKISIPNIASGYTLDDNARAMIALCKHYELFENPNDLQLITTYLQFINHCMQENGQFLNYVNEATEFTDQNKNENLDDSNGRAIWALGFLISLQDILPHYLTHQAEKLIQKALPHLDKIHSTRAMAFIIKGLHYQNEKKNMPLLELLADRMVQMYKHEDSKKWHWFEHYLTYGNSLLPEALLCAYLSTGHKKYKKIAIESFDFLLSKIFLEDRIQVISNKGWHMRDRVEEEVIGGEQPIDIAYTIMALEKFYDVLKEETYKTKAKIAFNWFLGDNHLHQIVYNPCTGGCYDGVEAENVNLNQGAESTVSYLMVRLTLEKFITRKTEVLDA